MIVRTLSILGWDTPTRQGESDVRGGSRDLRDMSKPKTGIGLLGSLVEEQRSVCRQKTGSECTGRAAVCGCKIRG